jgi:PTS system nitrogen regulatory IIA component
MPLSDLLTAKAVVPSLRANNKKQAIQELSAIAAELSGHSARNVFETLRQREQLGSTAIGRGVAIPHGKLRGLDRLVGVFARLAKPIDFDAMDGEPVDLVFVLLAPEGAGADHLKALARVARLLRDEKAAARLRAASDADALFALLTAPPASHAA